MVTFIKNLMKRETRLFNVKGIPMLIFEAPECISDDIVKYNDFWEYELFNRWSHLFPKDGLFLDIGANIGSHSLQFKYHFPNVRIWAFELHHENFKVLKYNLKRYEDVKCFNLGVGSRTSIINYNDGHFSNSGVVKIDSQGNNYNIVLALDDLNFNEKVCFIKIDIEGHELSAFEGMENLLVQHSPMIWLEDLNMQGVNYLKSLGYYIKDFKADTFDYLMCK